MNRSAILDLARQGELYPAVILYGGTEEERRETALDLARVLLCDAEPARRPCGACRHCRRIEWPGTTPEDRFHPDFLVLQKDLKTSTSVEASRAFLRTAQVAPFEARGQVFVIANAESLSGEAANSLLKNLEEPHDTAPRHFLLLAPSRLDLLATLRSRSLSFFLGASEPLDRAVAEALGRRLATSLSRYAETRAAVYLLVAAGAIHDSVEGWEDPRSRRPWNQAAAALVTAVAAGHVPPELVRRTLALSSALLEAPALRLRSIGPERILEGLLSRHLAGSEIEAV